MVVGVISDIVAFASHAPGNFGVLITTPSGQGVLAPLTYQYLAEVSEGGGGGGGCGGVVGHGRAGGGVGDLPALALLIGGFWLFRRRARA